MTVREDKKNIIFKEIKKDMEIKDNKLTINIPYGMEIDLQNSNFDAGVIKFKKKAIVDLKPKWNPKPFDRVVTRVDDDAIWTANIFSHIDQYGEYNTIGCVGGYPYCLPYNEETAKLIGTTNNWED